MCCHQGRSVCVRVGGGVGAYTCMCGVWCVCALSLGSLSVTCRACGGHTLQGVAVGPSGSRLSPSGTTFSCPHSLQRHEHPLPTDGLSGLKSRLPWTRWPVGGDGLQRPWASAPVGGVHDRPHGGTWAERHGDWESGRGQAPGVLANASSLPGAGGRGSAFQGDLELRRVTACSWLPFSTDRAAPTSSRGLCMPYQPTLGKRQRPRLAPPPQPLTSFGVGWRGGGQCISPSQETLDPLWRADRGGVGWELRGGFAGPPTLLPPAPRCSNPGVLTEVVFLGLIPLLFYYLI